MLYGIYVGFPTHLAWQYPAIIVVGSLLTVIFLEFTDCYQISALLRPLQNSGRLLLSWSGTFAVLAFTGFFMKVSSDFSRLWFGSWFVTGFVLLFVLRLVMSRLIRRWARNGRMERRAVIVGGGKAAELLIRSVEQQSDNDIRICGIFDDRDDRRSPPVVAGYPKLGNIAELIDFARIARIDMLIVSLPLTAETRVLSLLKKLWVLPVDIRLSAHSNQLRFRPRSYSYIGSVPMLDIFDKPINDWDSVAKRAFDIVFSLLGIVVFSPVMLATAIAIKLDSKGPVIFRQKRHGFNNEVIDVYKFRSMYVEHADPTAKKSVTRNDPPRHPGRPLHPQDLDRRTAAVLQRAVRLAVAGRPAAACRRGAILQQALDRGGRRLFRAPPRQAGRHRLGADQRLARRDRHRREDQDAHRVRPLLHRELVAVVRPEDHAADAVPSAQHGKRVLSAVAAQRCRAAAVNAKLIAFITAAAVSLGVFLSGFVLDEPAPYELYMAGLIAVWSLFGLAHLQAGRAAARPARHLQHRRHDRDDADVGPRWTRRSIWRSRCSSPSPRCSIAAVTEAQPGLFPLIFRAWLAAAILTSILGIAGYFNAFPGAEVFTLYGRAAGAFQDPNVFGPFLVLPGIFMLHRLMTGSVARMPLYAVPLLIVTAGIFFSFSRGAWGLFAASAIFLIGGLFLQSASGLFRLRVVVMSIVAVGLLLLAIVIVLQIPSVSRAVQQSRPARPGL